MQIGLEHTEKGLRITPAGCAPRLERAFAVSAGRGMLDLLRYGLPAGAEPVLAWLRERRLEPFSRCRLCRQRRREERARQASFAPPGEKRRPW